MAKPIDLKTLAADALDWIRSRKEPGLEAELYLTRGEERSIELRHGELDGVQQSSEDGVGLRLLRDGRMGFASAGGASFEAVKTLYERALPQLAHLEADPNKAFAAPPGPALDDEALAKTLWDETLFTEDWDAILPRLRDLESRTRAGDKRIEQILRTGYGESRAEAVVASTQGVLTWERGGSASVGLSAMCGDESDLQVGSAYQAARSKAALDFPRVAREAAERTVALLGAKKLPGGRRDVVFDPWISGEFLELISSLLSADQVQRGKSLLAGRMGKKVASPLVTFVDDPRMPGGGASCQYDDEGLPTRRKVMIDQGVVKEFFYDVYTAGKDGRESNASAGRGSFKGLPGPGCANFFLAAGKTPRAELLKTTKDGILVLDVMGMHMADPISGEFSVGVSGIAIRGGELAEPVKSGMLAGNVIELMERIDCVADDLTFYGGMGAPTFRVKDMNVA